MIPRVWFRKLVSLGLLLSFAGIPLLVRAAPIPVEKLPAARIVEETRAELSQRGCLEQSMEGNETIVNVPPGKPYRVFARDRLANTVYFCSIDITTNLTVVPGTTAGIVDIAKNITYEGALWSVGGASGQALSWLDWFSGSNLKNAVIGSKKSSIGEAVGGAAEISAIVIVNVLTSVGRWVFDMGLSLVIFALTPSTFITNPLVAQGWPLMQGIANVGFLIALLFIAFSTTLNLDIGGGVRKLLPRLFLAALLINFSLVFAGIILDLTKVLMAVLVNIMAGTPVGGMQALIYQNSGIFETMANIKTLAIPNVNSLVVALVKMIIVWSLALSMLALGIGLLIRYIMLIILLIVSPLAYLAFAFPAADSMGKRWWTEFFKYAFYGPIALFFLTLATRVADLGIKVVSSQDGIAQALNALVMSAILIAAATYAKQAGGSFSVATIGFLQGQAKRVGKTGLGVATYIPRKIGGGIKKSTNEQLAGVGKALGNYGLSRLGFDPTAKKPYLQKQTEKLFPALTSDQRTAAAASKRDVSAAVGLGPAHGAANVRTPALLPNQLQQKHIVQNMNEQEIRFLVGSDHTTGDQKEALLSNPEAIKKMQSTQQGRDLIQDILVVRDTSSDRPTNIGTDAQKRQAATENAIGKANQALVKALMKGYEKLDNPPA